MTVFPAPVGELMPSRKMHLRDPLHRQPIKKLDRIVFVVSGIVEDVRNIQKKGAVRLFADPPQKISLAERSVRSRKGVGHILQRKRPSECFARRIVVLLHPLHRNLFKRNGEEHRKIIPIDTVVGEMLAENVESVLSEETLRAAQVDFVQ